MTAQRIQLRRTKGWRKPPGAIVVARPSKWGNPFKVTEARSPAAAVDLYRYAIETGCDPWFDGLRRLLTDLRGSDLACWCPLDQPCHADVLIELANAGGAHP